MKRFYKKTLSLLTAALMAFSFITVAPGNKAEAAGNDIVVLYTNDIHCGVDGKIGYAGVAAYKAEMVANYGADNVLLVDAGDAIQGASLGALSKGEYIIDIMNKVGYDLAIPGNHEFDYGMDQFLSLVNDKASFKYLSCNFISLSDNKPVFDGYSIKEINGVKVAFVGVSTPESFTKSTPAFFQDKDGNYIYSFCEGSNGQDLYDAVQNTVNAAETAGADYVIAIAHLGINEQSSPWTSREVIKNTSGIDAVIDGHSHSTIEGEEVANKAGDTVYLTSTGTELNAIGKLVINSEGKISTELVTNYTQKNEEVDNYVKGIQEEFKELLETVVAHTDYTLAVNDPATGKRMVRSQETNLGDLCADAYRTLLGADIAFVNGGGVRATIKKGDITYNDIMNVHPYGNMACLIEATGQQILDALELGASASPGESGGFLQVSGLTYEINNYIPSSVKLGDDKSFISVDGEYRVKNVMVGGEPLDINKTYTLASHNYMLKSGGDGYSMFKGNKILKDEVLVDNEVLINYIVEELGGVVGREYANPYGQGRIKVVSEAPVVVDRSALENEVAAADSLKKEDYTVESWVAYETALESARAVLTKDDATQLEVDQALEAIQATKEALKKAEPAPVVVDKSVLENEVAAADSLKKEDYTVESWAAYETALESARAVLTKDDATQLEVDQALEVLQPAKEALKKAESSPVEEDKPNKEEAPKTGDEFNAALYGSLAIASMGAIVFIGKKNKKASA